MLLWLGAARRQRLHQPLCRFVGTRQRPQQQHQPLEASQVRSLLRLLDLEPRSNAAVLDPALLKRRYYALAKKMHPDVLAIGQREQNAQPWLRFAELTNAFEQLIAHARSSSDGDCAARPPHGGGVPPSGGGGRVTTAASHRRRRAAGGHQTAAASASASSSLLSAEHACGAALQQVLSAEGAAQLHHLADEIEEEGGGASLGIDGPQGAFNVWWLSRAVQAQAQAQAQAQVQAQAQAQARAAAGARRASAQMHRQRRRRRQPRIEC
jgi:hypothetical protein